MTSDRSALRSPTFIRNVGSERSFLARYMRYMKDQETARVYDYISALWCISSVIGRWSYINRPRAPVFLNLFTILAAESGVTRKSTSISIATRVVRDVINRASVDARLVESSITHSALLQSMTHDSATKGHTHVIFSISELAAVLGRQSASIGMPALLTDLYDCPKERTGGGTAGRGEYILSQVYCTLIGASTPSWLERAVTPEIIEGGFTSRVLFVCSEKPKALIPWPNEGSNVFEYEEMVDQLARILDECPKQITLSTPAMDIFSSWYKTRSMGLDPYRASFASREDGHVLRIAGLLCISDEVYEVNSNHIRTAIEIVTWSREVGAALFPPPLAGTLRTTHQESITASIDRLRKYLINAGSIGVFQSAIYTYMRRQLTSERIRTILTIMHELKMVQQFEVPQPGVGRKGILWRATKNIVSRDYDKLLYERLTALPEPSPIDVTSGVESINSVIESADGVEH